MQHFSSRVSKAQCLASRVMTKARAPEAWRSSYKSERLNAQGSRKTMRLTYRIANRRRSLDKRNEGGPSVSARVRKLGSSITASPLVCTPHLKTPAAFKVPRLGHGILSPRLKCRMSSQGAVIRRLHRVHGERQHGSDLGRTLELRQAKYSLNCQSCSTCGIEPGIS